MLDLQNRLRVLLNRLCRKYLVIIRDFVLQPPDQQPRHSSLECPCLQFFQHIPLAVDRQRKTLWHQTA